MAKKPAKSTWFSDHRIITAVTLIVAVIGGVATWLGASGAAAEKAWKWWEQGRRLVCADGPTIAEREAIQTYEEVTQIIAELATIRRPLPGERDYQDNEKRFSVLVTRFTAKYVVSPFLRSETLDAVATGYRKKLEAYNTANTDSARMELQAATPKLSSTMLAALRSGL